MRHHGGRRVVQSRPTVEARKAAELDKLLDIRESRRNLTDGHTFPIEADERRKNARGVDLKRSHALPPRPALVRRRDRSAIPIPRIATKHFTRATDIPGGDPPVPPTAPGDAPARFPLSRASPSPRVPAGTKPESAGGSRRAVAAEGLFA